MHDGVTGLADGAAARKNQAEPPGENAQAGERAGGGVGLRAREQPEPAQQLLRRHDEQDSSVLIRGGGCHEDTRGPGSWFLSRKAGDGSELPRRASGSERAGAAVRLARRAEQLSEVHQRPRDVPRASRPEKGRRMDAHLFGMGARSGDAFDGEEARENAREVGIHGGDPRAEGQRRHGGRHVLPESGKSTQRRPVARQAARVVAKNSPRRRVQVTRAGVVAEPGPGGKDRLRAGPGERGDVGEAREKRLVAPPDGPDRRLLEHHLRDPDAVGVARAAPGQLPLFAAEPGEQLAPEGRRTFAYDVVMSVRGAIQSGSFIRARTKAFSSSLGRASAACFAYASAESASPVTE